MYQGTKLLCGFEPQSPRSHRLRRANRYTRPGVTLAVNPGCRALLEKEGMYQGTKYSSFALPIELTCKLMAAHMGIEPMT